MRFRISAIYFFSSYNNVFLQVVFNVCGRLSSLISRREVSLGNTGPGGTLTRPADVLLSTFDVGQSLVLDFAVTHVQQPKYTDLVRDANWVAAGSFAERYATENKKKQREEAEAARHRFGAMVVETYGAWSPSAFAILKEVAASRSAYSGGLSKGEALHQLVTTLNVALMRTQARMLVLRLPAASPDICVNGYGNEE